MEGSLTDRKLKKEEEDFFFGGFTDRGEGSAEVPGLSAAPSKPRGLNGPSEKWKDLGDPLKEDIGGEVAQVEMLAADDSLFIVAIDRSLMDGVDGQLR